MIPVVDLRDPDEKALIKSISKAGRDWGIFQVINHGIPAAVVSDMQSVGSAFFRLPKAQKEVYSNPPEGYGEGLRGGWAEHIFHRICSTRQPDLSLWPSDPSGYRATTEEYVRHVSIAADEILRRLSAGLGLEGHVLKEAAAGGESVECLFKVNYYPPCPSTVVIENENSHVPKFGVQAHTDLSALTILVPNQVPGLQVLTRDDGRWIDVDYVPNALIIHIGDQIEVASNGFYKSVVHRSVVDKERTRMSWPVFFEPPPDFTVGPIPLLLNEENPPQYSSSMFKDYARNKLNRRVSY